MAYVVQGSGVRDQGVETARRAVSTPDPRSLIPELRAFLKEQLPDYMLPSAFVSLDQLPLTPNGKLDRQALPAPTLAQRADATYMAPRSPLEEVLASLWASVLDLPRVGIYDNFFALGGHSLLATQLLVRVRQALQVQLSVRALFEAPTVATFAERVVAARQVDKPLLLAPPLLPAAHDTPPLAFAQERLWFLDQLAPGNPFYNTPLNVRMDGQLELVAFARTLSRIVQRHAALRTTFASVAGRPVQIIAPPQRLALPLLDLRALPEQARTALSQRLASAEARRPFDLARGPLLRVGLLRLDDTEHLLLLTAHHIVFDGWSTAVFVREVQALYAAFALDQADPLPPLPIQYADYALWQRQWLQGAVLEEQLAFWRQQLRGAPAATDLPLDYPRPAMQQFRGARHQFTLTPALTHELVALSQRAGVTLFMLLLAAWQVVLARYSDQDDLCVGMPIAGRTQTELEGLIGFFVNTLVIRSDLSGNPTFRELLNRVRTTVLDAYEHQDVPFEMVVEAAQPARSLSHAPLFQSLFTLQNMPQTTLDLPGVTLSPLDLEGTSALFDLILGMMEGPNGLIGALIYNTDLFASTTTAHMLSQFITLLDALVADPDRRIAELPSLNDAERRQLYAPRHADADAAHSSCIHTLFEQQAARAPDAIAVVQGSQQLTYHELNRCANQLAHMLHELGVGSEMAIGICLEPSPALVRSLLGVLKAGGACVALIPSLLGERFTSVVEQAQLPLLITATKDEGRRTKDDLEASQTPIVNRKSKIVNLAVDWPQIAQQSANALAYPLGGATPNNLASATVSAQAVGTPISLLVAHHQICDLATAQIRAADIRPASRVLPYLANDLASLFLPLLAGATLCMAAPQAPVSGASAQRAAYEQAATTLLLPSALLGALSETELPLVRTLVVAGAAASTTTLARWAAGRTVYMAYGPTEAPFWAPLIVDAPARQRLVVGTPITPTTLYLLDARGQPVPIGVPGELHIGGATVARGYRDRPALTAERFIPNPFASDGDKKTRRQGDKESGDVAEPQSAICNLQSAIGERLYKTRERARALPDGTFELFGPRERHSQVRGFPVDRGVIVDAVNRHPLVRESVVVTRADDAGATSMVAYVVPQQGSGIRDQGSADPASLSLSPNPRSPIPDLRDFLKARLPDYMLPAAIVTLDRLPLTQDGALDIAALPPATEPDSDAQSAAGASASPALAIRQATLSSRRAELSSAKQALLEQRLRGKLTRPTSWSPVVAIQPTGTQPPFFCVHPVGGTVLCYVELARELGKDQPFYGLQSAGLDGSRTPLNRIEDMATSYLDALRAVQPNGPYRIGGWSLGGVVAFEMAQQLRQRGTVVSLFLIDCMAPVELNLVDAAIDDETLLLGFVQDLAGRLGKPMPLSESELRQRAPAAQLPYLIERARQVQLLPPEIDAAQMQHMLNVYKANLAGMVQYRPQPYPDRIIMLRAQEELHRSGGDHTMGWGEVAAGPVVIEVVPGNHYTILNPPQVQLLATKLGPLLAAQG